MEQSESNRYGSEQIIYPRIGQGTFKVIVTEAYHRRCAITGEKTSNGLLLRKDMHTLFDRGYITINEDLHQRNHTND